MPQRRTLQSLTRTYLVAILDGHHRGQGGPDATDLRCVRLPVRDFGFDMAQSERRYDVTPVTRLEAYLVSNRRCIGVGVQESWIRRQVLERWSENGWLCCGHRGAHVVRRRWDHRGAGIAITFSKPAAHADGVTCRLPRGRRRALRFPVQHRRNRVRTLIKPANRGADTPSRADTDAIGDEEPSRSPIREETTTTRPDRHCSPESVDCHPVGDYQPVADCKPIPPSSSAGASLPKRAAVSWFWWALAGLLLAAAVATPLLVRAHRRRVWNADFATAGQGGGVVCPRARP